MGKIVVAVVSVIVAVCSWSGSVFAGSNDTNGVAPRAKSMQNAFTAVADDPSAIFYNPAGLTQIEGTELYASLAFILPDLDYANSNTGISSGSTKKALGYNVFFSTDLVEPVRLGFGVYAPFARLTNYTANAAVGSLPHKSDLLRLDFVPTVAVHVGPYVSVGLGFVASHIQASSSILGFDEHGSGYGLTGA